MRTTVRLNEVLFRRAKKLAAEEGRTLTSIIEEGVRLVVNRSSKKSTKPFRVPVSKKRGGVLPGVDINKSSELEEIMNRYDDSRR